MGARKFKSDIIVRITSDCPLVDPSIVDDYIDIYNADTEQRVKDNLKVEIKFLINV